MKIRQLSVFYNIRPNFVFEFFVEIVKKIFQSIVLFGDLMFGIVEPIR